ncbi:putative reverse transcriptase zinc-binding domain-containing protein [Helianthus annuus]|nr:putative reverse transcriptase zinc-binding domain-containing protein [Helianthus annuus]
MSLSITTHWGLLEDMSFSVKSVKKVMLGAVEDNGRYILDRCKWTPSKCTLFVWRSEMDRIPTSDALGKRGVAVGDGLCTFCKSEVKMVEHIFTSCGFSTVLWQKISQWCRIPPIFAFTFRDLLEIHKAGHIRTEVRRVVQGIIIVSCWCLWMAWNKAIFSSKEAKMDDVFSEVKSLGFLWFKHRSRINHISWLDWCNFVLM